MLSYELKEPYDILDMINHPACQERESLRSRIVREHSERCAIILDKHINEKVLPNVCNGHTMTYNSKSFYKTPYQELYTFYCSCGKVLGRLELNHEVKVAK
jgi:hypothetical protein